jgi:outer membrane protein insertion porin family
MLKILYKIRLLGLFLLMAAAFSFASTSAFAAARIKEIQIKGIERIEPQTVLTYIGVGVGDDLTQQNMDKALKNLFATGLFADVRLQDRNGILEVSVSENPVINQIAFEGNDEIDDDQLAAEIQLRARKVFTRTKVQADVNRIYQIYQRNGRFSAKVEPKAIKLPQNRVNLVFEIDEGPITKVRSIRFVGNRHYDDDKLRSEISTKETRWYRFISSDDRYDPDRMAFDRELLRRFYLSQGYVDFKIISANAELASNRQYFYMTFTIDEGPRYKIGKIHVNSNMRDFDAEVLRPSVSFKEGDWYNVKEVNSSVEAMTDVLGDMQYAFVSIRTDIERNVEDKTVDMFFFVKETPRVFVERIDINGNVRTLDKVIRREFDLVEGDPFNKTKLAKSEQNIKDLGYFETVEVKAKQGSAPDKSVVDVELVEKSTGELSIGTGFSTTEGPLADVRIRERNFLGRGQDLLLATTIASERTEFDFSFTEPYFLDRDFSAGVDLFYVERDFQDESSFDQLRQGGSLRFNYPLSEKWRQSLRYRFENNDIRNVASDASLFIQEQAGERVTSAVSQRLTYDDRDSRLFPTSGMYAWLDTEVAGLGGDAEYVSGRVGASWYYPVMDKVVFNLMGETAAIMGLFDNDVVINERYFIGGSTLRGFEQSGIGPRDGDTDDALGGNYYYRSTAELSFPVGLPEEMGIKGHAFTDAGSLFELDKGSSTRTRIFDDATIRASAGVGVSWRSPLGPIRVDFAAPFSKEDYDREEVFRFNFGTRF